MHKVMSGGSNYSSVLEKPDEDGRRIHDALKRINPDEGIDCR
jgi:hypothetical protein